VYIQDRHIGDRHRDTTTVDEGKELHSQQLQLFGELW